MTAYSHLQCYPYPPTHPYFHHHHDDHDDDVVALVHSYIHM